MSAPSVQPLMGMKWTEKDAQKLRDLRRMKLIPLVLRGSPASLS